MFVGPVFSRELVIAPRRTRLFVYRSLYAAVLFGVICTAWLILTGTQSITTISDMARFGATLFQLLAPLQLAMVTFFAALSTASAVSQEKDRKTLILLLLTRLNNSELVLGRLLASLIYVVSMLLGGLPVFVAATLFGGISLEQIGRVFLVTLVTALVAGSLGSVIALWREKTFQTLALTCLVIVGWLLVGEALHASAGGAGGNGAGRWSGQNIAASVSPARAMIHAARPAADLEPLELGSPITVFLLVGITLTIVFNGIAIWRIRIWNPSREVRGGSRNRGRQETLLPQAATDGTDADRLTATSAGAGTGYHVDEGLRRQQRQPYRRVWDNPILWREVKTWAYGTKIVFIRLFYFAFFLVTMASLYSTLNKIDSYEERLLPAGAQPLIPFFIVSLALVNALAVTSITTERDGRSLDLLLVTDLSPKEFLFGKLNGILWVSKEMVLLPTVACLYLWWDRWASLENTMYIMGGLLVMNVFVAMLGIHCGSIYANSRSAIIVSLGTVFFLFLGIATCIVMMISFSGAFHAQLAPFFAFILGGGFGLYVALGIRNPSPAIFSASLLLPFATFYAITSFMMDWTLAVFLVAGVAYSFATAAMMIPALSEFDFSTGRSSSQHDAS